MDLSKLSDEDLQHLQAGHMEKLSDEALSHLSGEAAPAPKAEPSVGDKLMKILYNPHPTMVGDDGKEHDVVQGNPPLAIPAGAMPKVAQAAEWLNSSAPGRIAAGATQGAVSDPSHPIMGGLKGGAMAAGGEVLGKVGDALMQKSVGLRNYLSGRGTDLADAGVVGTKGMMRDQVAKGLENRGQEMGELVSQIPGTIDSEPVAERVMDITKKLTPSEGATAAIDQPKVDKITDIAADISKRGSITPAEALQRQRIAGSRGYKFDDPIDSLVGKAAQAEQGGYSSGLKDAFKNAATGIDDDPNALAAVYKEYGSLAGARNALSKDPSLAEVLGPLLIKGGLGAAAGYAAGGKSGAALGALMGTSAGQSASGQAAVKGGQILSNPVVRQKVLDSTK